MTNPVEKTFPQLLIEGAEDDPNRPCLVLPNESATYGEMFREALRIAKSLKHFGVSKGDPVGILMANSVRYVESLLLSHYLELYPFSTMVDSNHARSHTSLKTQESRSFSPVTKQTNSQIFAELLAKAIPIYNSTDPQKHLSWRIIRISSELCCSAKKNWQVFKMNAISLIKKITLMTRTYFQLLKVLI